MNLNLIAKLLHPEQIHNRICSERCFKYRKLQPNKIKFIAQPNDRTHWLYRHTNQDFFNFSLIRADLPLRSRKKYSFARRTSPLRFTLIDEIVGL